MATAKKTAAIVRRAPSNPTPDDLVDATDPQKQRLVKEPEVPDEETVTVVNPKQFTLTMDHGNEVVVPAGTQELPRSYAEHWFAKAQGLVIYEPKK